IPKNTSIIWKNHPTTTQQNLVTQNESSGNTGSEGVIETYDNTDSSSDLPVQNSIQSGAPPIQSTRSRRHIRPRVFNDTITGEWWKSSRVHSSHNQPETENVSSNEAAMLSILEVPEPRSYRDAKRSPHWHNWEKAFEDEIKSLQENNVWHVVTRPKDRKIVDGKWVCKVKGNALGEVERFKARYVAKGFTQV
ncbi:hypothetical protein K3495_g16809, partial [Podosphaera aphanis]